MTTPNQAATSDDSKATPGGVPVLGGNSMLPLGVVLDESTRAAITDISRRLTEPFPENEIEWLLKDGEVARVGDKFVGRCFAYVTARAVQERLDNIFGAFCWATRMHPTNFNTATRSGMICELSIYVPAFGWLTKADAADLSNIDPVRGGASGALKRVAVQFGIGRYLYYLPKAYAHFHSGGINRIRVDGHDLRWDPPLLPPEALPEKDRPARIQLLKERAAAETEAIAAKEAAIKEKAASDAEVALAAQKAAAATESVPKDPSSIPTAVQPAPTATTSAVVATTPAAPASNPAPAVTIAPAMTTPAANAGTPLTETKRTDVKPTGKPVLTPEMIQWLREIFGENEALSVACLRNKGFLPAGATNLLQIPVSNADALRGQAPRVAARMKRVFAVAKVIAGRDAAATTYFVGRNLVRSDQPWYAATDESLDKAIAAGEPFSRLLAKLTATSQGQQEQKAA
jgi:hypothetical protein